MARPIQFGLFQPQVGLPFPAISERLLDGEALSPGLTVAIDGELSTLGLFARVGPDSRIHIVPAISGG